MVSVIAHRVAGQAGAAVHSNTASFKPSHSRGVMALHRQGAALGVGLPSFSSARRVTVSRSARCTIVKAVAAPVEFDPEKEESLKYKRVVFDFDLWAKHRSSSRFTRHVLTMLTSRVIRCLWAPVLAETLWASAVYYYDVTQKAGELPDYLPAITPGLSLPFGLSSFALSLLLAYRVKESYGRFDEVRKFWGGVVNRTRDLCRQGTTWMDDSVEKEQKEMLVRWITAIPWSMMCHLRAGEDIEKELKDKLTDAELAYLVSTPHRPNTVLQTISSIIWNSSLTEDKKFRMDENLTVFADMLGASERILRTPLPVSYTRHTSRFLILWLAVLPLVVTNVAGAATIPACTLIATLLLATDEVGVQVEEPFSVLPLEAISATITANMKHHASQDRPDNILGRAPAGRAAVEELVLASLPPVAPAPPTPAAQLIATIKDPAPAKPLAQPVSTATVQAPSKPAAPANGAPKPLPATPVRNGASNGSALPANGSLQIKVATPTNKPLSRFDRKLLEYMQRKAQQDGGSPPKA